MPWHTANDAVLAEGHRALIADPHRFDGARVVGVDEHTWHHTRAYTLNCEEPQTAEPLNPQRRPARTTHE